jgi:hypothetical protein
MGQGPPFAPKTYENNQIVGKNSNWLINCAPSPFFEILGSATGYPYFRIFQQGFVQLGKNLASNKRQNMKNTNKVYYIERIPGGKKFLQQFNFYFHFSGKLPPF